MERESVAHDAVRFDPSFPLDRLRPYERNPRKNAEAVEAVERSLKRFGAVAPIIVDSDFRICAGHTRYKAASSMGMATFPVLIVPSLTGDNFKAYNIADNQTAAIAEWDDELLRGLLSELSAIEFDMDALGFDPNELAELLADANGGPQGDPDAVPEAPEEPITKPGDLWLLGDHRLLCGDSTRGEDVERLMGGARATCVFTDPPYGVSIGAKNRLLNRVQPSGRCLDDIECDDVSPEDLKQLLLPAFRLVKSMIMADDCTLLMTSPQNGELGTMMMMMMREAGLPIRHVLMWLKNSPTFSLGRLDYDYQHEPILLTWGARHKRPMAGEYKTSVWPVDKPRRCADHPTMKPVALYENAYSNHTDKGDAVEDPFAGSGPAFIASEQLGRRCYGMEIEPKYVDVAVRRWEEFTGRKAERDTE